MVRLYSDIQDGASRRYFYDLDSTPGILQPGAATLTIGGHDPQYPGTVFRTPATVTLTLFGRAIGPSGSILTPASAALAFTNSAVGLLAERTIQLTLASPLESPPDPFVPNLITQMSVQPAPAVLPIIGFNHSLSEGGNIGFLNPPTAALTLFGYQYLRTIPPVDGQATTMVIEGRAPGLITTLIIEPGVAALSMPQLLTHVDPGFVWIDDDPAPPLTWM